MSLDNVAEAIYRTQPRARRIPWEELSDRHKAEYRRMAEASIDAIDETDTTCPRCVFENAIADLVYAGEFIQEHHGGQPEQLGPFECSLLEAANEWLTNDTIARCLDEES